MTIVATNRFPSSFQLSTLGVGAIVTGAEDIRQCIDFILRTVKGSDPLRPLFGSDIFQFVDKPQSFAIPNIKKAIFDSLTDWEPRIKVRAITHQRKSEQLYFFITYTTVDEQISETVQWSTSGIINGGTNLPSGIILTGVIPEKIVNGRYNFSFIIDGDVINPLPPQSGFETAYEMYTWANENLFNYGKWYLTANKLILYMNSGIAKTASLLVTQSATITKRVLLPILGVGESYQVTFLLDGIAAVPAMPGDISTIEQLLLWVQRNWGQYGTWTIETNSGTITEGDLSADFGPDFSSDSASVDDVYLVFQTKLYNSVTLTII